MTTFKILPGIKRDERAKFKACPICGKPPLDGSSSTFYRIRAERVIADPNAIRRHVGLAMMLGSEALAGVMGTDEDMMKVFLGPTEALVHEHCAHRVHSLLQMWPEPEPQPEEAAG